MPLPTLPAPGDSPTWAHTGIGLPHLPRGPFSLPEAFSGHHPRHFVNYYFLLKCCISVPVSGLGGGDSQHLSSGTGPREG